MAWGGAGQAHGNLPCLSTSLPRNWALPRWGCFGSVEPRIEGARGERRLSNERGDLNSAGFQTFLSSRSLQSNEPCVELRHIKHKAESPGVARGGVLEAYSGPLQRLGRVPPGVVQGTICTVTHAGPSATAGPSLVPRPPPNSLLKLLFRRRQREGHQLGHGNPKMLVGKSGSTQDRARLK